MDIKEQIRKIVLSQGADLCGFANISRFNDAPVGFKPTDVYSNCKTVISFAVALPKGLGKISPRLIYGHYNDVSCHKTDMIAFETAKIIEKEFTCTAVPVPCDVPYDYWNEEEMEGRGLLSMKNAAVQCGLGTVGKSSLFITKRYGNMVTLGAVLINTELEQDNLSKELCIENCRRCIENCPVNAISTGTVTQKVCRNNAYGKTKRGFVTVECNICRTVCPLNPK